MHNRGLFGIKIGCLFFAPFFWASKRKERTNAQARKQRQGQTKERGVHDLSNEQLPLQKLTTYIRMHVTRNGLGSLSVRLPLQLSQVLSQRRNQFRPFKYYADIYHFQFMLLVRLPTATTAMNDPGGQKNNCY